MFIAGLKKIAGPLGEALNKLHNHVGGGKNSLKRVRSTLADEIRRARNGQRLNNHAVDDGVGVHQGFVNDLNKRKGYDMYLHVPRKGKAELVRTDVQRGLE